MFRYLRLALSSALALSFPAVALGQVAMFDASDYGKTDLPLLESTGDASAYIAANDGAFEPIRELPEDDPIRRIASAIGRVDILQRSPDGSRGLVTCSGSILPGGWVLTNHHCIPEGADSTLLAASIVTGYLVQGQDAARYTLSVAPEDWHSILDFSLVRMREVPTDILPLMVSDVGIDAGDPLIVIHHPLGRPQVMTRFRCFAAREQADDVILRHRCDTQPGSSGSILFDRDLRPVALHHTGGMTPNDDRSFNKSTRLTAILQQSALLREIVGGAVSADRAPASPPAEQPLSPEHAPAAPKGLSAGGITDILRGD
ncbi:trypsin-like serine peptidase [Antarctobacter jejuensis]|uniref:trypsin-like serine peptidase n=1 Tax=Antarctobacter jejuensis TaxID=1439938 RepID=UPI003FD37269